jgi:hypothetical protein
VAQPTHCRELVYKVLGGSSHTVSGVRALVVHPTQCQELGHKVLGGSDHTLSGVRANLALIVRS